MVSCIIHQKKKSEYSHQCRGWIDKAEINPFGYLEKDKEMLLLAKRSKKPGRIKEVKKGYKYACDLAHIDATVALAAVFAKF